MVNINYKTWLSALKIIPGGNMLISKRPPDSLIKKYPIYFSKCDGSYIWDLNGKKYLDMFLMGVGTNILGYNNKEVNRAVQKVVKTGNISSLNSIEDLKLAKELVKINNWADMVKFARTGGEANTIAVRIARAYSKKDLIAFCGYHGWHDWYLSANLSNKKNLDTHLFPNLRSSGVPKNLKNTSIAFNFNDSDGLRKIIKKFKNKISAIKLEIQRSKPPSIKFIKTIKDIQKKQKILIIVDECTSGFRETFGGLYKKFNIRPDIVIFGKSLGNGYPITAIIGKKKVMKFAEKSFISSTFWTDRIGTSAALETLKIMKKKKSWIKISNQGKKIKKEWKKIAKSNNIPIEVTGLDAMPKFEINHKKNEFYKQYIASEMLKKKILAKNVIYLSISHSNEQINIYMKILKNIFAKIGKDISKNKGNKLSKDLFLNKKDISMKRLN